MRKIRTSETACPWCGYLLDGCANPYDLASPNSGDLSVCIKCAGLLELDRNLCPQKLELHTLLQIYLKEPQAYEMLIQLQKDTKSFNESREKE